MTWGVVCVGLGSRGLGRVIGEAYTRVMCKRSCREGQGYRGVGGCALHRGAEGATAEHWVEAHGEDTQRGSFGGNEVWYQRKQRERGKKEEEGKIL